MSHFYQYWSSRISTNTGPFESTNSGLIERNRPNLVQKVQIEIDQSYMFIIYKLDSMLSLEGFTSFSAWHHELSIQHSLKIFQLNVSFL